jgi:hypothetical protein
VVVVDAQGNAMNAKHTLPIIVIALSLTLTIAPAGAAPFTSPLPIPNPVPCYFVQVQFTVVLDREPDGTPITWYVYFFEPGTTRLNRITTFWPAYAPGDWFRICGVAWPWGEWSRVWLPFSSR